MGREPERGKIKRAHSYRMAIEPRTGNSRGSGKLAGGGQEKPSQQEIDGAPLLSRMEQVVVGV